MQQIDQNEVEKDRLLGEWTTFSQANIIEMKLARDMVEGSNVSEEVQSTRGTLVQR